MGELLKELIKAMWLFFRYHLVRMVGSARTDPGNLPVTTVAARGSAVDTFGPGVSFGEGQILSSKHFRPSRLSTSRLDLDCKEIQLNPVFQLWKQRKPRAHKWTHYFDAYQQIFAPVRSRALRILEIGVQTGASLRIWKSYFDNPKTMIVGIDIDPTCAQLDSPGENIHVRIGSQSDSAFLDSVTREFGPFDIIIDDGSHHSSHLIQTFDHLFAGALNDEGIYVAEDLHANYWLPWRDTQLSFLDMCKVLMELMHSHYTQATFAEWLQESNGESPPLSFEVPIIATMIKEIRVFDSIVAIYKTRREFLPRLLNPQSD